MIYSRSGFTKGALEKSRGICCCRLYDGSLADIPHVIWWESCACQLQMRLSCSSSPNSDITWGEVFEREVDGMTFLDHLHHSFRDAEREAVEEAKKGDGIPESFCLSGPVPGCGRGVEFKLYGLWRFYKARREAHLLNGSYCLSSGEYSGSVAAPMIDMQSSKFSDEWQLVDEPKSLSAIRMMIIKFGSHVAESLRRQLGHRRICESCPE